MARPAARQASIRPCLLLSVSLSVTGERSKAVAARPKGSPHRALLVPCLAVLLSRSPTRACPGRGRLTRHRPTHSDLALSSMLYDHKAPAAPPPCPDSQLPPPASEKCSPRCAKTWMWQALGAYVEITPARSLPG